MVRSITEFEGISDERESELWRRFSACAAGDHLAPGKQDELHALIREAHVVVESENELLGLFVTQKPMIYVSGRTEPRFVWISHVLSGPHKDEVCMGDQDMDVEFQAMQRP